MTAKTFFLYGSDFPISEARLRELLELQLLGGVGHEAQVTLCKQMCSDPDLDGIHNVVPQQNLAPSTLTTGDVYSGSDDSMTGGRGFTGVDDHSQVVLLRAYSGLLFVERDAEQSPRLSKLEDLTYEAS